MNHVLVPVDAGPSTPRVLVAARAVAALFDVPPLALHVGDEDPAVRASTDAAGVALQVTGGAPLPAIVRAAEDPAALAVVLGAQGLSARAGAIGSTALDVITRVDKPVVVVPPDCRASPRITRVLTPLEGSEPSSQAITAVLALAHRRKVEIVVLHVHQETEVPPFQDQPQHQPQAWEHEFAARFVTVADGPPVVAQTVGSPAQRILAAADEAAADLVVLGWSQTVDPGRAQVVREALAHAPVPVLLVPSA